MANPRREQFANNAYAKTMTKMLTKAGSKAMLDLAIKRCQDEHAKVKKALDDYLAGSKGDIARAALDFFEYAMLAAMHAIRTDGRCIECGEKDLVMLTDAQDGLSVCSKCYRGRLYAAV